MSSWFVPPLLLLPSSIVSVFRCFTVLLCNIIDSCAPFSFCYSVVFGKSGVSKTISKKEEPVYAYMLGLATGNPKYRVSQTDAVKIALAAKGCENLRGVLERIYGNTRISHRYMAIPGKYLLFTINLLLFCMSVLCMI